VTIATVAFINRLQPADGKRDAGYPRPDPLPL